MVWAIVVVAIAVLGAAAWAGTGRLGEMPEAVTDRPKAHIPDGPVDQDFLEKMALPIASTGYRRGQVDEVLASHVAGATVEPELRFDVVRRGYDMQVVDMILDRLRPTPAHGAHEGRDTPVGVVEEAHQEDEPAPSPVASGQNAEPAPENGDAEQAPDSAVETHDPLHREGVEEGSSRELPAP